MTSRRSLAVTVAMAACLFLAWKRGTSQGESVRARIVEIVRQSPGIYKSELARLSGLSWGSVNHHLRVLRRSGELVVDRRRALANVYPAGTSADHIRWIGLLGRPDNPDLVGYLRDHPGHGVQSMSQHYNISRKIIRRHLARLEEVGLVTRSEDYRPKFFLRDGRAGPLPLPAGKERAAALPAADGLARQPPADPA